MLGKRAAQNNIGNVTTIMRQVNRMVAFIELEGNEKVEAIQNKTEEEYNLIVGNEVQNGRRNLVEIYDKKLKALEKEEIRKDQMLATESRMNLFLERQQLVINLINEIQNRLIKDTENIELNNEVLSNCILQSLLILLENHVILRVTDNDTKQADALMPNILERFKDITEIECKVKIAKKCLHKDFIGGCILYNMKCTIKVSNTIKDRFNIIIDRLSHSCLRSMLFGINMRRQSLR